MKLFNTIQKFGENTSRVFAMVLLPSELFPTQNQLLIIFYDYAIINTMVACMRVWTNYKLLKQCLHIQT